MIKIIILVTVASSLECKRVIDYENSITFTVFNNETGQSGITTFSRDLTEHDCDPSGSYAIVVHGWKESITTPWVMETINNLMYHRGGCVIFMDYSNYSVVADYFVLTPRFFHLAGVLLRKIKQIGNYGKIFMFGFSFGSRLCFEVGARLGNQVIDRIDACDPAGPGFDNMKRAVDPKLAAKHVSCINTSIDKGTSIYNCHQNFRMGKCGSSQPASGPRPLASHGLCPYFYNSAFDNEFTPSKDSKCKSKRTPSEMPDGLRMGYLNEQLSDSALGDIFVLTTKDYPWNVVAENSFDDQTV